jgi:hypothetical protein
MQTWLRGWEDKGGGARPTQQRRDSPCAHTATNGATARGIDGVAGRDDQAAAPGRERSDAAAQGREVEAARRREAEAECISSDGSGSDSERLGRIRRPRWVTE